METSSPHWKHQKAETGFWPRRWVASSGAPHLVKKAEPVCRRSEIGAGRSERTELRIDELKPKCTRSRTSVSAAECFGPRGRPVARGAWGAWGAWGVFQQSQSWDRCRTNGGSAPVTSTHSNTTPSCDCWLSSWLFVPFFLESAGQFEVEIEAPNSQTLAQLRVSAHHLPGASMVFAWDWGPRQDPLSIHLFLGP